MKGLDIDFTWVPTDRLSVTLGLEFMDGEFKDYPDGQFFVYRPGAGGNCAFVVNNASGCTVLPPNYDPATGHWNLKGNDTSYTPPFTGNLTVSYELPTSIGKFNFTGNWYRGGDYYGDADNGMGQIAPSSPDNNKQERYDMLNASVTWYSNDEKWSVRLWGKNLTDKYTWAFANETGTITKQVPGEPRTYGLTANAHF
jgi:iron complex outermembrane recepter protein